jgi:hypothetical protein
MSIPHLVLPNILRISNRVLDVMVVALIFTVLA